MNQKMKCVNLHTHTNRSDGKLSPRELVIEAIKNNNGVLAFTDHNLFLPENLFLALVEEFKALIKLIRGIESSCEYEGKEIHAVFLFRNTEKVKFLEQSKMDRKGYITAIGEALLKNCNIKIPTYQELLKEYPETSYLGRKHVADWLYRNGFTKSVDEALDEYIGKYGKRKAFVDSAPYRTAYPSLEANIKRVREQAGEDLIAIILCHPDYYGFRKPDLFRLFRNFKEWAGPYAGIENIYFCYDHEKQAYFTRIANMFGFLESGASDYHGQSERDTLYIEAPLEKWERIEENWKQINAQKG